MLRPSCRSRPLLCIVWLGVDMKASELQAKGTDDLRKELESLLKAQFSMRMQKATQQLTNTSQLRKVRRDIARVRTVLATKA